jgi:hypothetical protein
MAMRPWAIAGASVTGTSHAATGAPCQDAHAVLVCDGGEETLLVAAADGAGTARLGGAGARLAVDVVVERARAWLAGQPDPSTIDRTVLAGWVASAREAIDARALEECGSMRDYAATLLLAIVGRDHAVFGQIGDGAMVARAADGGLSCIFQPQRGEFANSTCFVTDEDALERLMVRSVGGSIGELAVFTDGIEPLVLDYGSKAPHGPFFEKSLQPLRETPERGLSAGLSGLLAAYLVSPTVSERADDDLTLVLASRQSSGAPPAPSSRQVAVDVEDSHQKGDAD